MDNILKAFLLTVLTTAVVADLPFNEDVLQEYYGDGTNWIEDYEDNGFQIRVLNLESKQEFVYFGDRPGRGSVAFDIKIKPKPKQYCGSGTFVVIDESLLEYCIHGIIFTVEPFDNDGETVIVTTTTLVFEGFAFGDERRLLYIRIPMFAPGPGLENQYLTVTCEIITKEQIEGILKGSSFKINFPCLEKLIVQSPVIRDLPKAQMVGNLHIDAFTKALRTIPAFIREDTMQSFISAVQTTERLRRR